MGINAIRGPWVYTSSQTKLVFENWAKGQPCCKVRAHNCAGAKISYGGWYDRPCKNKFNFICEFF